MKVKKSVSYALHALIYMVRHKTQLPATTRIIAKSEGISPDYLAKVFQILTKADFVKSVKGSKKGYTFKRKPEDINLLELIETVQGETLFNECFLNHCNCGGTKENCRIFYVWCNSTKRIRQILEETSIDDVAWNHPEHTFDFPPVFTEMPANR